MPPEFDRGMDEAVDRFWDQVSQGRAEPAANLDVADAAAIRHLHAFDDRQAPRAAFTRQLREELMHASAVQVSSGPSAVPHPNGRGSRPWRIGFQTAPSSRRHWVLAQLATAALLVLTLGGAFFAFGPGRFGQPAQQPMFIPAISATPATPDADEPIAEFVWGGDGGPDFPFEEPNEVAVDPQGNVWVADGLASRFVIYSPDGELLEAWGTPGSGDGEFNLECDPFGFGDVAFDAAGNIYVADSGNQRIQKFGPDRAFLTSWGSAGFGDDEFLCPADLAVDGQGRVYVSDQAGGKVGVFDQDGGWLATWSGIPSPRGIEVGPDGNVWVSDLFTAILKFSPDGELLATWDDVPEGTRFDGGKSFDVDAEGRVFVASYDGDQFRIFAPDGALLGAWGESGVEAGQFTQPRGIALDGQGAVYVAEGIGKRVQKFRLLPPLAPESAPALSATPATPAATTGRVAEFLWQSSGGLDFPFGLPGHPAIDGEGRLWVPDAKNDRYLLFAPDGTFLEAWGASGSEDGAFEFDCDGTQYGDVAFDPTGNIFVLDSGNHRIQKFGPDRAFITAWGSEGTADDQLLCASALAVDAQGRVYVTDEGWGKVKVFGGDGASLGAWGELYFPAGITTDGDGNVWVVDSDGIWTFSPAGETLAMWQDEPALKRELDGPAAIAVDAEGRVFVASFDGDRIQVFSPKGELLADWGERGNAAGEFLNPSGIVLDGQGSVYVTEHSGLRVQKFRLLPPLG